RRRHTRSDRDWSSDVCSSDLYHTWLWGGSHVDHLDTIPQPRVIGRRRRSHDGDAGDLSTSVDAPGACDIADTAEIPHPAGGVPRSEERRVGKERRTLRTTDIR